MKEKTVIFALAIVAFMVLMMISQPIVNAFDYYNTNLLYAPGPQTDNYSFLFGPMADHVQIVMYSDEIAEFAALEQGKLDITDWPVDSAHYPTWTGSPYNTTIAVVNTGAQYGMFDLDIRMNNETMLYTQTGATIKLPALGPNPAYIVAFGGNPCADVWLRRAIASCVDRKYTCEVIVSGSQLPPLAAPIYSPATDPPYTGWGDPGINPNVTYPLKELCYALPDGSSNCTLGNKFLDEHGYLPIGGDGYRTYGGKPFQLQFMIRSDDINRKLFGERLVDCMRNCLHINVAFSEQTSGGAKTTYMDQKAMHLYTAGWGLTSDPDQLYYLYHINNYHHPGRPNNYAYYPGDYQQITVPYNGWQYNSTNIPSLLVPITWGDTPYTLDFSDPGKTWKKNDKVWVNPQNYWSWEMMISTNLARATLCAHKSEEAIAEEVCGVPVWTSAQYSAFYRRYSGPESPYTNQPWKGVVDQKSFGVWGTRTFLDMHTANALFGNGNMTIRWGFRQPTLSLNPIYAEWVWDWYALNQCYDAAVGIDPYVPALDIQDLATNWELGTWNASTLGLGTCTMVTFHLRQDALWSDGVPITSSDFVFSWGGHKVATNSSIASLLDNTGNPPPYWDGQIADMLTVAAPDPWTVIVYLDVYAYFGLHSMSGWNIVLPEHIWRPFITSPPAGHSAQDGWNVPSVCSYAWKLRSTAAVTIGDSIWLDANPLFFQYRKPVKIWTQQKDSTTPGVISLGQTHWLAAGGSATADVALDLFIHNLYAYETGPEMSELHPDTWLDGLKNVTLWKWTGVGCPNDPTKYAKVADIETNVPWQAKFCEPIDEYLDLGALHGGWYQTRVTIVINSLSIDTPDNYLPPSSNPFYGLVETYSEEFLVTLRYDFTGLLWKPCPPATAAYQAAADLTVDMKDVRGCAKCFGSYPGHARWNPQADMNGDLTVDMKDIRAIAKNFGWHP